VGMAILGPLRELDEVAYLRFASVYRAFTSAEDFETEIALLRAERAASADEPAYAPETAQQPQHPQQ
jgi:transcriptional repressor NrdR